MSLRFNNGNGAITCDVCGIITKEPATAADKSPDGDRCAKHARLVNHYDYERAAQLVIMCVTWFLYFVREIVILDGYAMELEKLRQRVHDDGGTLALMAAAIGPLGAVADAAQDHYAAIVGTTTALSPTGLLLRDALDRWRKYRGNEDGPCTDVTET